ncbi:MAG: class 1 isoprenoid biosynthesis enzyme [Deltaproteobacteria bacterium]|nr:class 1 isoprenoid biosynthesis enzyme [Deltaproteobacteria bacterium]
MKTRIADLLSYCSGVDFGTVPFSQKEKDFRDDLNHKMLSFLKFLPESTQEEAFKFLMYSLRTSIAEGLNFVRYFYVPAWSILFWLHRTCPDKRKLGPNYLKDAKIGHNMAMYLHALDDHLADGQLPVTHLTLLVRSQAWMHLNQAFGRLARGVEKGGAIVSDFVNDYYSSIETSDQLESLDSYCDLFRKQMATWLIAPVLLAKKISTNEEFVRSIESSYVSFGIAWRLLDDIQDLEKDLKKGVHSSLYICLPTTIKKVWNRVKEEKVDRKEGSVGRVLNYIQKNGLIDFVKQRICTELESAASRAEKCDLAGFAAELRCLSKPLWNGHK